MRVLITGFEPTWGIKKTPSGELAKLWMQGDLAVPGIEVHAVVLPQVFGKSAEITVAEIQAFDPQAVLMFGATMKNDPLRLERFAINCEASEMGDNTRIPVVPDRSIIQGGPAAYESTLPVYWLMDHLNAIGVDAKVSYNAGTHTCNSLMYNVLHFLATKPHPMPVIAGFVHVPFPNEFGVRGLAMDNGNVRRDSPGVGGAGAESTGLVPGEARSGSGKDKHFCSIRYVDEEGDQVIRHAFLTTEEQQLVVEEFARRGMKGEVFDLNPAAVRLSE